MIGSGIILDVLEILFAILLLIMLYGINGELKRIGDALCGTAWQEPSWEETPLNRIADSLEAREGSE